MKQLPAPNISKPQVDAFFALALHALAWLAGVMSLIGAPFRSRRLRRAVKRWERAVECIIFLRALERYGLRPRVHGVRRASAPAGFRRQAGNKRVFMRSARIRARSGGLRERVRRLLDALSNPEPYIARFTKRLVRGVHGARLFAVAPPASALAASAPFDLDTADTS